MLDRKIEREYQRDSRRTLEAVFEKESQRGVTKRNVGGVLALGLLLESDHHLLEIQQGSVDVLGLVDGVGVGFELVDALAARQIDQIQKGRRARLRV